MSKTECLKKSGRRELTASDPMIILGMGSTNERQRLQSTTKTKSCIEKHIHNTIKCVTLRWNFISLQT